MNRRSAPRSGKAGQNPAFLRVLLAHRGVAGFGAHSQYYNTSRSAPRRRLALRTSAKRLALILITCSLFLSGLNSSVLSPKTFAATQQQSAAVGVEGTIPSNPPTQAPTIVTPVSGQSFATLPVVVAGLCPANLLIEVFKNDVFSGSAQCTNGSYTVKIDLFSGRNDIVARGYDALNQAGPDSNKVTVNFNEGLPGSAPRVSLTTSFAKRGAAPGDTLSWPLTISGGSPPYAVNVDWGDKSTQDLISLSSPGDFTIQHVYTQSGVYNITVKASDKDGGAAFLQLVGIGNGTIQQATATNVKPTTTTTTSNRILLLSIVISFPLLLTSFWLGKKHQLQVIRTKLRRGERPF